MKRLIETLQPLGRALMLPIAVLPVAGLLLRLGQPDLLDIGFVSAAGDALFSHLGLLFAIGVATGYARDGNGAACLAGIVCYLVTTEAAKPLLTVPGDIGAGMDQASAALAVAAWKAGAVAKIDVPIGIVSGLIGGNFYNRFSATKLPDYLAFFGGRRFVPIVSGVAGLVLAAIVGLGFGAISAGVDGLSHGIAESGEFGLFAFGVLNRLLLVTGLHHVLNNVFWFVQGDYMGATGDLRRFFAGDPSAGAFMAGFFPVMMFGLPAACLAMYHAAPRHRRAAVGGMLFSLALTSLLTGVTEPIEYSFMFLAPVLYAVHAVLTGAAMVIMNLLGVKLGFGFSAGLFDYLLNYGKATRPLMLLPVGVVYFLLYYGIFSFVIRKMNLPTPGREPEGEGAATGKAAPAPAGERGAAFARALGGGANLREVGACTTRLRLIVEDQDKVDGDALKALGAHGVLRPSANAVQVVVGPIADVVAMEIRDAIDAGGDMPAPAQAEAGAGDDCTVTLGTAVVQALGGTVRSAELRGGRIRLVLADDTQIDEDALQSLGIRGVARVGDDVVHLLLRKDGAAALLA